MPENAAPDAAMCLQGMNPSACVVFTWKASLHAEQPSGVLRHRPGAIWRRHPARHNRDGGQRPPHVPAPICACECSPSACQRLSSVCQRAPCAFIEGAHIGACGVQHVLDADVHGHVDGAAERGCGAKDGRELQRTVQEGARPGLQGLPLPPGHPWCKV